MASFTRSIDLALKTLLYHRFGSILGINTQSSMQAENINQGLVQCPKEVALRVVAEKRGEDFLEFINFWRMGTSPSWSRQRTPVARRGMWLATTDDNKTDTVHVKAVPADLNYNVWFWSKDLDKVYQCIEEYLFWQQDDPNLKLKYNDKYEIEPDLHFGEIVDESTVDEMYTKGLIYVFKMPIKIDAWILKGESFKTINKLVLTLYDKDDVTNYREVVVEDSDQDTELEALLRMFRKKLFAILSVDKIQKVIVIPNDRRSDFSVDDVIYIENSTANNGKYIVAVVSLVDGNTEIKVIESLVDDTANGNIYKGE